MQRRSVQELQAAGSETQSTYLGDYITATTIITGANRDQTSTIFTTSAGQFIPPTNVILNPQNPTAANIELKAGRQVLFVESMTMVPPNPEQKGYLTLTCWFTDVYGEGRRQYTGIIANWTLI